jgi:hypothetical protein
LANAQHLRGSEHDECEVAADGNGGNRLRAQSSHPVEIDEHVQRLKNHADQHVAGRPQQMPRQRSGREILHALLSVNG